ncbi:HTH domain-containing protein [Marivita sp.]|uniref:HTH domain-containing protein n=1 Tax=Marivita sp. TaxID=2003365 RepID=UPI003B52BA31
MKRSDRLYALMQRLKDGRLHTAEAMAQDLGVSVRTIYRDMDTLAASAYRSRARAVPATLRRK